MRDPDDAWLRNGWWRYPFWRLREYDVDIRIKPLTSYSCLFAPESLREMEEGEYEEFKNYVALRGQQ